jgi:hypothetical protein
VALGLALYIWSLADAAPAPTSLTAEQRQGKEAFSAACAGCHEPPSFTGRPVPIGDVGTDPSVGMSLERGTGTYRVPSLHLVGTRGPLMHDASIATFEMLMDPARLTMSPPAPGHRYGLDLDAETRAALIAYLKVL